MKRKAAYAEDTLRSSRKAEEEDCSFHREQLLEGTHRKEPPLEGWWIHRLA